MGGDEFWALCDGVDCERDALALPPAQAAFATAIRRWERPAITFQ